MKNVLGFVILLLFTVNGICQTNLSIEKLKNGLIYNFEVTKIKYELKNDELIKNDTSKYLGEWKFIEEKDDHLHFEWILKDDFLEGEALSNIMKNDLAIVYSTTKNGEFLEVKNWKPIKKYFSDLINKLDKPKKKVLKGFYKDEYFLTSLFAKEIMALHEVYIYQPLGLNDTITFAEDTYNILSDNPILTNKKVFINSFDEQSNLITIKREQKYDPNSASELIIDVLKRFSRPDEEKEIDRIAKDAEIDMRKTGIFNYNSIEMFPLKIEIEQRNIIKLDDTYSLKIKSVILEKIK